MSEINQPKKNRQDFNEMRAFLGTILLAGTILFVCLYVLYVLFSIADKPLPMYIGAAVTLLVVTVLAISITLTLRKQQERGVQLAFISLIVEVLVVSLVAEERALSSSIFVVVLAAVGFFWLFPQRHRSRYVLAAGITLTLL